MNNLNEIKEKLFNNFTNKDLTIILEGNITTDFIIRNAKISISNKRIMLSDGNKTELIICIDNIINTYICNYIELSFEKQKIIIDY